MLCEIDHCTASRSCSACGMNPTTLLLRVDGRNKTRQVGDCSRAGEHPTDAICLANNYKRSVSLQVLALMAVRATATLTQRSKDIIAKNLTLAEQFFKKWSSVFEWIPPQGSPICFPRVKSPGVDIAEWCEKCVDACGVLLLPASVYEHEASSKAGHFRFSLGRENMRECLDVLDTYLSGLSAA